MAESKMNSDQDSADERPGLVRLRGINWPWMVTEEALDTLKTYDIWDDDVWIATCPKGGTHWVTETVHLILVDGHEHKINRDQMTYPPEFDFSQSHWSPQRPPNLTPQYKLMKEWDPPRVIMTHLPEEMMPTQIYQGKGKVIFLIRNPKDIIVSEWHFVKVWKFDTRFDDFDFFFQQYLKGETMYGSWFDRVLNFWNKHRHDKNFLFIMYEEMKQDTRGAVIQIADFLGKPLSEDAVDRVLEFCSLESMKTRYKAKPSTDSDAYLSNSQSSADHVPSLGPPSLIRKGIVGDWRCNFTVAQNEAFDALFEEKMAGSGLKIQFE